MPGYHSLALNIVKSAILNRLGVVQYPSFVTFFLTWACNLRCGFCDVWKKPVKDEMTVIEIASIFRQLRRLDVLRITGGEPFVRKDMGDVIEAIVAVNDPYLIHITTNGILTDRIVNTLSTLSCLNRVHLKISIDDVGYPHDQIRGVDGAYEKSMNTIRALLPLRERSGMHIGVNQAIVDEENSASYERLKATLKDYCVPVYASIAYDSSSTLYSEAANKNTVDPDSTTRPHGRWSTEGLRRMLKTIATDSKEISDFAEQIVDNYFMKGLYRRFIEGRGGGGPSCVALNSHLRLLPNGDVPICLHNGKVVGNLRTTSFRDLWFGSTIAADRKWVADCSGCWVSCETSVSAIYTGDIWKGLLRSRDFAS